MRSLRTKDTWEARVKNEDKIAQLNEKLEGLRTEKVVWLTHQNKYHQDNQIEFFNRPNPKQKILLEAWPNRQFKVFTFTGANRTGKTTIGTIIGYSVMFGEWPWSGVPINFAHGLPRKVRYIGQDWEAHIKAVVVPALKKWWPKRRLKKTKKNNVGAEAHWEDAETGSTLEIMSNRQDVSVFEGWEGDLIIYDEPPRRDIRIASARGLIDRQGRELFCMTLLKEAWVDHEVIKKRLPDGRPDKTVFNVHAEIYDNVGFGVTEQGVEDYISKLNADEIEARIKGVPSYRSGLVYKDFRREVHVVERFKIPLTWMVDISIDIHPRKEQAVLFVATDPKNERYVFWEIWEHGDGTYVAEEILRVVKYMALRVHRIIIDPLAKGDDQYDENTTFTKIWRTMANHGFILETASKDKNSGILEVKNHLIGPNRRPSMFFFEDLVRTLYEVEGYMYDKDTQKPQKVDDDMMENLYRICLLNTEYVDPEEIEADPVDATGDSVDSMTGY